MKKPLILLLLTFSLTAFAQVVPVRQQGVFDLQGFHDEIWGTKRSEYNIEEMKKVSFHTQVIDEKDQIGVLLDFGIPDIDGSLIVRGFASSRLVWAAEIHIATKQPLQVCKNFAEIIVREEGLPTVTSDSVWLWRNQETVMSLTCTAFGPIIDYSNTLYQKHHTGFVPHMAIKKEIFEKVKIGK